VISSPKRLTLGLLFDALEHEHPRDLWQGWQSFAAANDCHAVGFLGGYLPSMCGVEGITGVDGRNVVHDLPGPENVQGLGIRLGALSRDDAEAQRLCSRFEGLPLVNLGFNVSGLPNVKEDDAQGIGSAVAHLVRVHGRRRIGYLRGPDGNPFAEARFEAFAAAMAEQGLAVDPALTTPGRDWSRDSGAAGARLLLERGGQFDALLTANDRLALGAMGILNDFGRTVPGDVAVIGFDNLDESRLAAPPLTTIQFPSYALGHRAAEVVWRQIGGREVPRTSIVASTLVVRQSCGCAPEGVAQPGEPAAEAHTRLRSLLEGVSSVGRGEQGLARMARAMAELGLESCRVAVYTEGALARELSGSGAEFPRRQLVPGGLSATGERQALVVLPLVRRGTAVGHVTFSSHEALRWPVGALAAACAQLLD
jgi:hypothetical protein